MTRAGSENGAAATRTDRGPRSGAKAAVLAGLGGWLPSRRVTNSELAAYLDTSDDWIRGRTGIGARHWVVPGTSTGDLAVLAGGRALRAAGTNRVDAVVVATTTPDRLCPATAPEVAYRLGLAGVAAYDVAAVCTGFLYGLACAVGMIAAGNAQRVLLIGAETYSSIVDPTDRTTAVIFADGAAAVVLRAGEPDEPGAIGPCDLGSDGGNSDLIQIPAGGSRQRSAGLRTRREDHYFQMRGRQVYRHAVDRMSESALTALDRAGWVTADVDRFVPHQANGRISDAVADRLGIGPDRVLANIEHVGNTAAASIPLLLAGAAAGGGGLTWAATTLVWPRVTALADPPAPNHNPSKEDSNVRRVEADPDQQVPVGRGGDRAVVHP
jgi:3-oxoacyl-[acyl-carrier-protein] synthase-3